MTCDGVHVFSLALMKVHVGINDQTALGTEQKLKDTR